MPGDVAWHDYEPTAGLAGTSMNIMNKRNLLLGALGTLGILGVIASTSAYAASDALPMKRVRVMGNEAMKSALAAGDYESFKAAIAETPRPEDAPEITEAMFEKMAEAHRLHEAGDHEAAEAIMKEAGFPRRHVVIGSGPGMKDLTDEQREAMKEARELFASGKPDEARAVLAAAGIQRPELKLSDNLTDEQKAAFETAHELFLAGKSDEAKAVLSDAGIERPVRFVKKQ